MPFSPSNLPPVLASPRARSDLQDRLVDYTAEAGVDYAALSHPPSRGRLSVPKLLDQTRDRIRTRHYSIRTEATYLRWIRDFIIFHRKRHPKDMGAPEVRDSTSLTSPSSVTSLPPRRTRPCPRSSSSTGKCSIYNSTGSRASSGRKSPSATGRAYG